MLLLFYWRDACYEYYYGSKRNTPLFCSRQTIFLGRTPSGLLRPFIFSEIMSKLCAGVSCTKGVVDDSSAPNTKKAPDDINDLTEVAVQPTLRQTRLQTPQKQDRGTLLCG